MLKGRKKDGQLVLTIILAIVFIGQLIILGYYNLCKQYVSDCDAAKVFYHTIKIWENGGLIIPNWVYMTTGEWDCASLIALPLYGITKNIFLSFGISNIINILLFGWVTGQIFRNRNIELRYFLLIMNFVLLPYAWGMLEYSNMMFYGASQYIYKVLVPLWLIEFGTVPAEKRLSPVNIVQYVLYVILLMAVSTSSSTYVLLCGIIPVTLTWAVYQLTGNWRDSDGKEHLHGILLYGGSMLVSAFGVALHGLWGVNSSADTMTFKTADDLWSSFVGNMGTVAKLLRPLPIVDVSVFSEAGIQYMLRFGFFALMLMLVIPELKYVFGIHSMFEKDGRWDITRTELISLFVWNYLVLTVSKLTTPRYFLIGVIPLMILAVMRWVDVCASMQVGRKVVLGFEMASSILLCIMTVLMWRSAARNVFPADCSDIYAVVKDYADENDIHTVVIVDASGDSEIMRLHDYGRQYVTYHMDADCFHDSDYYEFGTEEYQLPQEHLLLFINESVDYDSEMRDRISDGYELVSQEDGNYKLYYSAEPWKD